MSRRSNRKISSLLSEKLIPSSNSSGRNGGLEERNDKLVSDNPVKKIIWFDVYLKNVLLILNV